MPEAKGSVPALQKSAGVLLPNIASEIKARVFVPAPGLCPGQALRAVLLCIDVFVLEMSSHQGLALMICHGPATSRRLGGLLAPAKQSLIKALVLPLRGHTFVSSFALHRGECSESLSGWGRGGDRRMEYLEKKEKSLIPVENTQQQHRHTHIREGAKRMGLGRLY